MTGLVATLSPVAGTSAKTRSPEVRCPETCGEDSEHGWLGAVVRAVLADVGVGADGLGGGAQAVAAREPGLDEWQLALVSLGLAGWCVGKDWSEALLRQREGAFVVGVDGRVEQAAVAIHRRAAAKADPDFDFRVRTSRRWR
jgi:hypothetical protein